MLDMEDEEKLTRSENNGRKIGSKGKISKAQKPKDKYLVMGIRVS